MRVLQAVWLLSASAVTLALAQAPPEPATPAAIETNAPTEVAAATTSSSEAVILQQLVEKIEKLESRAMAPDPAEFELLRKRLNDAEAKLFQAESKQEAILQAEVASRNTLHWVVFVVVFLAFASIVGLVTFSIYTLRRITQLGEPIFDNFHKPHLSLPHHGHAAALPHPSHNPEGHIPSAMSAITPVAPVHSSAGETRLLDAVDRLERKIEEIEKAAHHDNHVHIPFATANGHPSEAGPNHAQPDRAALLINKGDALTNLGRYEQALAIFEEAIALAPTDPAPLVKKGYALEKMGRFDEAVQWYDRAIELDGRYSMAYLLKGSVYNRLQRYTEAIECYDKALTTQTNDPRQTTVGP